MPRRDTDVVPGGNVADPKGDVSVKKGGVVSANVAVTEAGAVGIVIVQIFETVLVHPDQLVKVKPLSGAAVRITGVPAVKEAEQVAGQLMPGCCEEVTTPVPLPLRATLKTKDGAVTVTDADADIEPPGPVHVFV